MRQRFVSSKPKRVKARSLFSLKGLISEPTVDTGLLYCIVGLLLFGWVMVYSSSAYFAAARYGDQYFFLKRQMLWSGIGIVAFLMAMNSPMRFWQESAKMIYVFSLATLVLVLLMGPEISGAKRWIRVGSFGFQPSEVAKVAMVFLVADYMDRHQSRLKDLKTGFLPLLFFVGVLFGLILIEPDLGTPILMGTVLLVMLILGGARWKHLMTLGLVSLPIMAVAIIQSSYRVKRMFAFLDPWSDPHGSGYQLVQSLLAMGSGGIIGRGFGDSKIKMSNLPDAHTDFVFSVIGEEMGLLGTLSCASIFLFLSIKGLQIASRAPNLFSRLVAAGVSLTIGFQALINMGVASGLFPTKGMPLPFISFGGSSLVIVLFSVGLLAHVSRQTRMAK